jgi:hypothetical protein
MSSDSGKNGKLSIVIERDHTVNPLLPDSVCVSVLHPDGTTFKAYGNDYQHVVKSVHWAIIRSCLDVVPGVEEPLPF